MICTAVDAVCDEVGNSAPLTPRADPLSLGSCLRPFRARVPAIAPRWADSTTDNAVAFLVGFVVPKREIKRANGRNRVKRQLRHLMRERIDNLPEGSRVVVRASGRSLGVSSKELGAHLDRVMSKAWRKWDAR